MTSKKSVSIVPDIRLLVDIGAANYTVPEAISELIANSIDARIGEQQLEIEVTFSDDQISIVDNASGMSERILGEAMRLSAQMDQITGNKKERKGTYGLGMKAACASLGRVWRIVTRPPDSDVDYSVTINLDDWLSKSDRQDWVIDVITSPFSSQDHLGDRSHGTAIVVTKLRETFSMAADTMAKLGMVYKPHLEAGDQIFVNGDPVLPKQYDLIDNRTYPIDLKVGEYIITGWVGLDKKTHNDGAYGLNIYRQKQLVEAWNKDFFRKHLMTSRIVGEVHLDFVRKNFHTLGFFKGSEEWKLVGATLKEFLKPVVKASETTIKGRNDPLRQARAMQGLDQAMGVIGAHQTSIPVENPKGGKQQRNETSKSAESEAGVLGSLSVLGLGQESFCLAYTFEELSDDSIPWDYVYDSDSKELQAVINTKSRVFERVEDENFLGALALAEAVVGFLINEREYKYDKARDVRDQWLYLALEKKK
jgi:hypothetical protein